MTEYVLDIKKIGHGLWWLLHTFALQATTIELKNNYKTTVNLLCHYFPCEQCKPDFEKFILTHPLINYNKVTDGYFKWSWELHDMVNKKLNKPSITYEEALQLYKNNNCQNCAVQPIITSSFLKPIDKQDDFHLTSR